MSTALRELTDTDETWLRAWLAEVAERTGYLPDLDALFRRTDGPAETRVIERDGTPRGVIIFRAPKPREGSAVIEIVATPAEHARRGVAMQGMALLEEELRVRGALRIYAPAPERHGIAMYFWIRLGYRPLPRDAWPCGRAAVAWLARDLTN